jgi:uncharacterized protein (DUF1800 family)
MDMQAAHALVRFGLGRRGAEFLSANPDTWLLDQLRQSDPARFDDPPSTHRAWLPCQTLLATASRPMRPAASLPYASWPPPCDSSVHGHEAHLPLSCRHPASGLSVAIESILRDTHGDLGAAAADLLRLDAAWQPGTKLRSPQDSVIAAIRVLDLCPAEVAMFGILADLGQPLWTAPAPNGWPDRAADWAAPEAMLRRIDWAYRHT